MKDFCRWRHFSFIQYTLHGLEKQGVNERFLPLAAKIFHLLSLACLFCWEGYCVVFDYCFAAVVDGVAYIPVPEGEVHVYRYAQFGGCFFEQRVYACLIGISFGKAAEDYAGGSVKEFFVEQGLELAAYLFKIG